jgi:hypothetical protein
MDRSFVCYWKLNLNNGSSKNIDYAIHCRLKRDIYEVCKSNSSLSHKISDVNTTRCNKNEKNGVG